MYIGISVDTGRAQSQARSSEDSESNPNRSHSRDGKVQIQKAGGEQGRHHQGCHSLQQHSKRQDKKIGGCNCLQNKLGLSWANLIQLNTNFVNSAYISSIFDD